MRGIYRLAMMFLALAAVIAVVRHCSTTFRPLRLSDRKIIGTEQMMKEVGAARVVYVGEVHDRMRDHAAQLRIIEGLRRRGVSLAIGMEMFAADSQPQLDRWTRGELDAEQMRELYRRDWNMPWYLYRDILLYARSHHIPVIGLNVPRDISRKVAQEGFSALSEAERKRLPDGVTCSVDPAYREFIAQAFAAHVHSEASFLHFCEAQMLWNRGMALNLQRFMARSPGRTVVVLTGTGHAMRRGMPEEFAQATGYSYTVLLPETPELDRTTATTADADYLLLP